MKELTAEKIDAIAKKTNEIKKQEEKRVSIVRKLNQYKDEAREFKRSLLDYNYYF